MTYDEIVEMTEEIGLPVAYDHFAEGKHNSGRGTGLMEVREYAC